MKLPWRGLGVIAGWMVWPVFVIAVYNIVNMIRGAPGCDKFGCHVPTGLNAVLVLLAVVSVPILLTRRWLRWRRDRPAERAR